MHPYNVNGKWPGELDPSWILDPEAPAEKIEAEAHC